MAAVSSSIIMKDHLRFKHTFTNLAIHLDPIYLYRAFAQRFIHLYFINFALRFIHLYFRLITRFVGRFGYRKLV